ncbi:TetR family transcriptional regulator [Paenibacillus macerans]|nr:TetR family transcriptional regulator [Paenibacillus macerans]
MNGFERRANFKKQHIIQVTREQFKSQPPSKISVRDIAKEAKVSVVTLYNYFQSKEGLVQEGVRTILSEQLEQMERVMRSSDPFPQKLQQLIMAKNALITHFSPEFLQEMRKDKGLADLVNNEFLERTRKLVEDFIEEGKRIGELSEDMPSRFIYKLLELFRKDISSENSILLDHDELSSHKWIMHALLYGITRRL